MKNIMILSLSLMALFFSACKKGDVGKSSIFVHAFTYDIGSTKHLENATVFTVPESQTVLTDEFGMATITGLKAGDYDVYLFVEGKGSGKKSIKIGENTGERMEITYQWNVYPDFMPIINILEPEGNYPYYSMGPNDTLPFILHIENGTPGNKVVWTSDIDSVIGESTINEDLFSRMDIKGLTQGDHQITIKAISDNGFDGLVAINLKTNGANRLHLYPLEIDGYKVKFTWSRHQGEGFREYALIEKRKELENGGYPFEVIKATRSDWDTTFETTRIIDIDREYYVRLSIYLDWSASESNRQFLGKNYVGDVFEPECRRMIFHNISIKFIWFIEIK
jgi:hypothetical protein